MPIYGYACPDCGHQEDMLLKSDAPAPECPKCGSKAFAKELSAPGFELKGRGWYKTDFKDKPAGGSCGSCCGGGCGGHSKG